MYLILAGTIVVLCVVNLLFNYNERARIMKKIPGPPLRFLTGNILDFMLAPVELFKFPRHCSSIFKGIHRIWSYPFGAVLLYNPEDIETVLSNSKYNDKSIVYKFLKPWLGDGLLISRGAKWQHRRKILTPAFHFSILRHFSEVLEENSRKLADKLDNESGEVTVDVTPILSEYTLHSICETAMGTRLDEEASDAGRSYKEAIYKIGGSIVNRLSKLYLFSDFIFNLTSAGKRSKKWLSNVHDFTKRVIKDRKEFIEKNGINLNDKIINNNSYNDEELYNFNRNNRIAMLDLLITAEKNGEIDEAGIQEEVDTFMFEGHDTTGSGLVYLLMELANNKEIQEKIYEELQSIFGDSTRPATMHDLNKMKYLDICIKESLRLYPPVHFISRELHDPLILSNYEIPAGTLCHILIFDLHRREDLFKGAAKFNPDRFLPENSVGRHPYSYIPFSAGPRNCIGQKFAMLEMKSCVSTLLRKFEMRPVTKPTEITLTSDIVLRNLEPVKVTFVKRCPIK